VSWYLLVSSGAGGTCRGVQRLLETVGNRPIILGIGDMVMGDNLIERVQYIAYQVEQHVI
jgi:hypothetical protein